MKKNVKLSSFYYDFPVFLVTTTDNSNGNINVSSVSSSISLGDKIIIGVTKGSKTCSNLLSGSDVVINIPDYKLWEKVEDLGKLTGSDTLSEGRLNGAFRYATINSPKSAFTLNLLAILRRLG